MPDDDDWMNDRTCIVTREAVAPDALLRFVAAPDGTVTPDLRRKLPGRGVWVSPRRSAVEEAVRRKLFARGLKREVSIPAGLAGDVDRLLEAEALSALSLARKAGALVTGFAKVEASIRAREACAVLDASDGSADGRRKLEQAIHATFGEAAGPRSFATFTIAQMDLALGGANVVHAAALESGAGRNLIRRLDRLEGYRDAPASAGAAGKP